MDIIPRALGPVDGALERVPMAADAATGPLLSDHGTLYNSS